jgi:isoleucyl-tRNA synthetase
MTPDDGQKNQPWRDVEIILSKETRMTETTLPKTYDFSSTEKRLYQMWEEKGYFKPSNDPNQPGFDPSIKPFVISIPPPNVTGILHLGHAMFVSMEDLMIRYHRMKGEPRFVGAWHRPCRHCHPTAGRASGKGGRHQP